jgi:hypothetical protein
VEEGEGRVGDQGCWGDGVRVHGRRHFATDGVVRRHIRPSVVLCFSASSAHEAPSTKLTSPHVLSPLLHSTSFPTTIAQDPTISALLLPTPVCLLSQPPSILARAPTYPMPHAYTVPRRRRHGHGLTAM